MRSRRGPKPQKRVRIDRKRFDEVLKYSGYTVTSLAEKIHISKDALYKQRDNPNGIHEELLDTIAEKLDVDVDFIKGRYNFLTETCKPEYKESIMRIMLEKGRFPYKIESKADIAKSGIDYRDYYQTIIPAHGITFDEFRSIPFKERLQFQAELENAIVKVFKRWFGGDGYQQYEYLSELDYINIEEIYDWSGLDYIEDPDFSKKLQKFWAELDEYEKNLQFNDGDDDDPFAEKYRALEEEHSLKKEYGIE